MGSRLPDHLYQHAMGVVAIRNLSQESHTLAIHPVTRLQPEVESEAIHGRYRRFVGILAHIVPGDQAESLFVVGIHVLDDSRCGLR